MNTNAAMSDCDKQSDQRMRDLHELVDEILLRRSRGEYLPDKQIIAQNPEMMPELAGELSILRDLQLAALAAQRAGPAEALPALTDEELSSPIRPRALRREEDQPRFDRLPAPIINGYTVLEPISHGGQGCVYLAIQESTGRKVAVKVLRSGACADSASRTRFDRERTVLASLSHPNIVGILDAGRTSDNSFFLAMPFIAGVGLDDYLLLQDCRHPGDLLATLQIFVKIADAVGEAHRHQIIHRDLKPSNIRIDPHGQPWVLDFGLAHVAPDEIFARAKAVTLTGQMVGSIPWFSPEQAAGTQLAPGSDAYALGVMLYQTVTGQSPYPTIGPVREVLNHIVCSQVRPPSSLRAVFGDARDQRLDEIILKALAKGVQNRYASGSEFADALREFLQESPSSLTVASIRPKRSSTAIIAVIMSVALIALLPVAKRLRVSGAGNGTVVAKEVPAISILQVPNSFVNGIGMRLTECDAGTFAMGSPVTDPQRRDDEVEHSVTLSHPFWIAATPVTMGQYTAVMGKNTDADQNSADTYIDLISYDDAKVFCDTLSQREHRIYRLPTEAEWEYVCRKAMAQTKNDAASPSDAVAIRMPAGMEEWCSDWYGPYPVRPVADPTGAALSFQRVVRGGNSILERQTRAAHRNALSPTIPGRGVGFRVVTLSGAGSSPIVPTSTDSRLSAR